MLPRRKVTAETGLEPARACGTTVLRHASPNQSPDQTGPFRRSSLANPILLTRRLVLHVVLVLVELVNDVVPGSSRAGTEEEKSRRSRSAAEEVLSLRRDQDPAVAGRTARSEDAVQRVWGPVQVRPALTRVPARL